MALKLRAGGGHGGIPTQPIPGSGTLPTPPAPPEGPFTFRDGNFAVDSFPETFIRTAGAATLTKQQQQEVTGWGIGSMQFYPPASPITGISTFEDCISTDVFASPPGARGGTGEANFWFGNRTEARRLYAARTGWMAMFTGSWCSDSIIEDFEIEQAPVGVYIEHVTRNTIFRRFKIHNIADQTVAGGSEPGNILQARSISIEWWYADSVYGPSLPYGGKAGSYNLTFEDGDIYCPAGSGARAGVFVDAGTFGLTFRRCRFWGPGRALVLPNNRIGGGPDAVIENCIFQQSGANVTYHNNAIG